MVVPLSPDASPRACSSSHVCHCSFVAFPTFAETLTRKHINYDRATLYTALPTRILYTSHDAKTIIARDKDPFDTRGSSTAKLVGSSS